MNITMQSLKRILNDKKIPEPRRGNFEELPVRACLKIRYTITDKLPYYGGTYQKGVLSD